MPRVLQPTFFNYGIQKQPFRLTVHQKFNNHSMAWLDFDIRNANEYSLPDDGTPVSVLWGNGPQGLRTFYGYNNHYDTRSDRQGYTFTQLVALGTSKSLNTTIPTNWPWVTRSGVVREIAKRHKLRSIIHPHPVVLESWTTGLRSDFQALRGLAEETGYRMWVDGATVYFLDPERLLVTAQRQAIPLFTNQAIRHARVVGGGGAPTEYGTNTRKIIYGLDYRNNEFFEANSGDPSLPEQMLGSVASTYTEADVLLTSAQKNSNAFYTVELLLNGDATVEPGTLIQLGNTSSSTDLSGLWAVTEAIHELTRQDFTSTVTAIRNQDQTPGISFTSTLLGAAGTTDAIIRDGSHWEAIVQEHVNV